MVGAGAFPGEGAGRTMGAGRAGRGQQAQDAPLTCGQLLQRYRVLAGLTQEELAERAGYSSNYIGKLEQDQRELPAAAADRLAGREAERAHRPRPARRLSGSLVRVCPCTRAAGVSGLMPVRTPAPAGAPRRPN
jgi:hypothetical protein